MYNACNYNACIHLYTVYCTESSAVLMISHFMTQHSDGVGLYVDGGECCSIHLQPILIGRTPQIGRQLQPESHTAGQVKRIRCPTHGTSALMNSIAALLKTYDSKPTQKIPVFRGSSEFQTPNRRSIKPLFLAREPPLLMFFWWQCSPFTQTIHIQTEPHGAGQVSYSNILELHKRQAWRVAVLPSLLVT